jgi:hypothetical protein
MHDAACFAFALLGALRRGPSHHQKKTVLNRQTLAVILGCVSPSLLLLVALSLSLLGTSLLPSPLRSARHAADTIRFEMPSHALSRIP